MRNIKLVIFDLDGTLVDSLAELAAAINHVRSVFGLSLYSEREVRKMLGSGGGRLVEKALPEAGPAEMIRAQAEYLSYSAVNLMRSTRTFSGVPETLAELNSRGVIMAIVSNKHSALSRDLLRRLGIDEYFSAVLGYDSLPFRKPSPEPFLKILRDLNFNAFEAVVVGDGLNDILAGRNAGIVTIGCSYGYGDVDASELKDADYLISSLPELLGLPLFDNVPGETAENSGCVLKGLKS